MKQELQLPEEVFNLLAQKKYSDLSATEQAMAAQFLNEKEYNDLQQASYAATSFFCAENIPPISNKVPAALGKAIDAQFPKRKPVLLQTIELWKAAAVFLLLFGGSAFYLKGSNKESVNVLTIHDTVFTEKNIETVRHIIDTVIEYKTTAGATAAKAKPAARPVASKEYGYTDTNRIRNRINFDGSIRTLQPDDLPKALPRQNGKSLQEDELTKRFNFARI